MVDGALRHPAQPSKFGEGSIWIFETHLQHFSQSGRQTSGFQGFEDSLLASCGLSSAGGVGGVEVGNPVRVRLDLTEHSTSFVLEHGIVKSHLGEQGRYTVRTLGICNPSSPASHYFQRDASQPSYSADKILVAMNELQVMLATGTGDGARSSERTPQVRRRGITRRTGSA
jgi:hypothetical protein